MSLGGGLEKRNDLATRKPHVQSFQFLLLPTFRAISMGTELLDARRGGVRRRGIGSKKCSCCSWQSGGAYCKAPLRGNLLHWLSSLEFVLMFSIVVLKFVGDDGEEEDGEAQSRVLDVECNVSKSIPNSKTRILPSVRSIRF